MYDDSKLYYIMRAEWLNGRPVWVMVIITAAEARRIYSDRVRRQRLRMRLIESEPKVIR
jgi:hypothetical protein